MPSKGRFCYFPCLISAVVFCKISNGLCFTAFIFAVTLCDCNTFSLQGLTMKACTMMKNKKLRTFLYITSAVILIMLIISLRCCNRSTPPPSGTDSTTESTADKVLDFVPAGDNNGRIQIPAVTGLNMRAGQLEQTVDFYNPKENSCYFVITLCLSNDTVIYKSGIHNRNNPEEDLCFF